MSRGKKKEEDGSREEKGWVDGGRGMDQGSERERREREMAKLPSLEVGLADTTARLWVRG